MFESWKNSVLGKVLDTDGIPADADACSQVGLSWAHTLFPKAPLADLLPMVGSSNGVDQAAGKSTKYFMWIQNNTKDINQLPLQGDILLFGATPAKGYTNKYKNPDGHQAVCDSASPNGYTIVQQDAPNPGEAVNDSSYPWSLNPCLGWWRAVGVSTPEPVAPTPLASSMVGKTLTFAATNSAIPTCNVGGPYAYANHTHLLDPKLFKKALSYPILRDLGNGFYAVQTADFGVVAVTPAGQNATIG